MKKLLAVLMVSILVFAATACGDQKAPASSDGGSAQNGDATTITVAASPTPHAEILEALKDKLADEGIELKVKVYNDYVVPNTVVEDGEVDANYFQHLDYLEDFNEKNGTHLVSAAGIH